MKKFLISLFLLVLSTQLQVFSNSIAIGDDKQFVKTMLGEPQIQTFDSEDFCVWIYKNKIIDYELGYDDKADLFVVKFDNSEQVKSFSYYIKEKL